MSTDTDLILARAQISLSHIMALGFLGVIFVLIFFHAVLDETSKTLLTGLAGVLGTIVTQQSGYWFQRQRPDGNASTPTQPQVKV